MTTPRTCLVTGAGSGLGRALALHLAAPGTRLLLHYHSSETGVRDVAAQAHAKGAKAVTLQADLSLLADRDALMDAVERETDALHLLINNVGVYPEQDLLEITPAQWTQVVEVTCGAVFHLTQRAVPLLQAGAPAHVVNLGDSGADRIVARVRATPYHVAKLGVHVLTRSFAKELAPHRINVNQISPGFLQESVGDPGSPFPKGRRGAVSDILGALDYLISPAAEYVTGTNLVVAGGWNL